jgi:hypothetical protein
MIESRAVLTCPHCASHATPMLILYSNQAVGAARTWSCRECGHDWPDCGLLHDWAS